MSLETEVTEIIEIENLIGQVQVSPTSNTILDRLKQIQTNTGSIGTNNFTTTNSTNVDLSKADLDTINTATALINTNLGTVITNLGTINTSTLSGNTLIGTTNTEITTLSNTASLLSTSSNQVLQINPFFEVTASIQRPNNTTAYAVNQAFGNGNNNLLSLGIGTKMIQIDEVILYDNNTNSPLITPNIYFAESLTLLNWADQVVPSSPFNSFGNMIGIEEVSNLVLTKIPGSSTNLNTLKSLATNLNIKIKTDSNGYVYWGIITSSIFTPIAYEQVQITIKGRFL